VSSAGKYTGVFVAVFVWFGGYVYGADSMVADGYQHAMDLLSQGVVFEAMHEMEMFVESHPDHEDARMQLALMLHQLKRERRAAEESAQVLRINPANAGARRLLTSIRIKLERKLDRKDPEAVLDYARLCARPETYGRAADFYELYLGMNDNPQVHLEFGKMLYWAERYNDAKEHFMIYLRYNPGDIEVHKLLGKIHDTTGNFDLAVGEYRKCLSGGSGDVDIQLCIARSLMWQGKEAEAEELLTRIRKSSRKQDVPLLLAAIARVQGHTVREYDLYKEVLKTDPGNKIALARVQELEQGDHLQEVIYLEKLQQAPSNTSVRRKLVNLYFADKRYGEAIPHLKVLNRQIPHDLALVEKLREARDAESRMAMEVVKNTTASLIDASAAKVDACRKWLIKNPNDYETRLVLADLLLEMDQPGQAIAQLEILESMTPSVPGILERLDGARRQAAGDEVKKQSVSD
jgi:tetratricopeptide (TPR) repeat protein